MTESGGRLAAPVARYPPPPTGRIGRGRWCAMRVRGRRRRINGEQGSEAQPGRPARRRGRGVRRGGPRWCGPGRGTCRSTRCGSGRGRRWFGTAIPLQNLLLVDGDAEEVTVNEPTSRRSSSA